MAGKSIICSLEQAKSINNGKQQIMNTKIAKIKVTYSRSARNRL